MCFDAGTDKLPPSRLHRSADKAAFERATAAYEEHGRKGWKGVMGGTDPVSNPSCPSRLSCPSGRVTSGPPWGVQEVNDIIPEVCGPVKFYGSAFTA